MTEMATMATMEEDTRSSLILYKELAPNSRLYVGPEGVHLQNFIELHCPYTSNCHLGMLDRKNNFKHKKNTIVESTSAIKSGSYLNICETLTLTNYAFQLIGQGQGEMEVLRYTLRCKGGFHNGIDAASGSNCHKVAPKGNTELRGKLWVC
jgi:hypothetical protein